MLSAASPIFIIESNGQNKMKFYLLTYLIIYTCISPVFAIKKASSVLILANTAVSLVDSEVNDSVIGTDNAFIYELDEEKKQLTVRGEQITAGSMLYINTTHVKEVIFKGSGNIQVNTKALLKLDLDTQDSIEVFGNVYLSHLSVKGAGSIKVHDLHSQNLSIVTKEDSTTTLMGEFSLSKLVMQECSWLKALWCNSEYLSIQGYDQAFAMLAGNIRVLDMDINDHAYLQGRFLRAEKTFVKTHNNARADIFPIKKSFSLANDKSNIYSYATNDTSFSFGNVLRTNS